MITFHNDYLVPPVLCEILYDTVDESLHRPVIFIPCITNQTFLGEYHDSHIDLYLHGIFNHYWPGEYKVWKLLLYIAYHEFGHVATVPLTDHISEEEYRKEEGAYRFSEQLANDWARKAMLHLAKRDKRLFQPQSLGAYFEWWIVKRKKQLRNTSGWNSFKLRLLEEYRKRISGGQLSSREVASIIGVFKYPKSSSDKTKREWRYNPDLICKLADDLAYIYTDSAGRRHRYFAYGDLPEIEMRYVRYEYTHKPTRSFLEYQAQQGMPLVDESN
jgi:hypothetical protein